MARKPLRPLIRSGGFYPSRKWTPLVYAGGYTTANGGEEPTPPPIEKTVTGTSPLSLVNAIAHSIKSLTQTGKCSQASTPTPTSPVDIYCNNGALKMLNLANMTEDNIVVGKYINNSGTESSAASNFYYSPFIPVKASTAYTLKTSASLNYANFMEYDANGDFLKRTLYRSADTPAGDATTHTTRADTAFLRFGSNINGTNLTAEKILAINWMLTAGATAMDYVPYGQISVVGTPEVITVTHADSTTQTAGAENLFAVGDYADTQEIISGAVTRNCGVLVFDGTEDWTRTSIGDGCTVFSIGVNAHSISGWSKITSLCTHFECYVGSTAPTYIAANAGKFWLNTAGQYFRFVIAGTMDLTRFTAWLTTQYEAGTPVIVLYPLTTPTTESVTAQPLSTTAGTNTVSWTAEVSGKTISAEYKGDTRQSNKVGTGKVGYMKI